MAAQWAWRVASIMMGVPRTLYGNFNSVGKGRYLDLTCKCKFRPDGQGEDPLGDGLAMWLRTAPCALQRQRALEEEMHIRLPRHAHGSVYLQAGSRCQLCRL